MTQEQPAPLPKLTRSMIFPLIGGRSVWSQEHLLPIFVTLVVAMALFVVTQVDLPWPSGVVVTPEAHQIWQIVVIVALYMAFLMTYYINQMCGRAGSGWLLALVGVCTFALLSSPVWDHWASFFYVLIPGQRGLDSANLAAKLAGLFSAAGLCEEGFKALPLFALALLAAGLGFLARHSAGRLSALLAGIGKRIGLCEPLHGIVFGVASGCAFFLHETLYEYVPDAMRETQGHNEAFAGMVALLGRGLPQLAEHAAWAGLFGYFIGLSVLYPRMAVYLLALGWLSAATLHWAWDALSFVYVFGGGVAMLVGLIVIGLLSYALLAGAIFKAREISPNRAFSSAAGSG